MSYAVKNDKSGFRAVTSPLDCLADETFCVDCPPPITPDPVRVQIMALEIAVTPRRVREAVLGEDSGWLAAQDAKIAALRAQL